MRSAMRGGCALLAALVLLAAPAGGQLPPEGQCPTWSGGPRGVTGDGGLPVLREGDRLGLEDLMALSKLFPEEVWNFREAFFYDGMRMELGFCHRRYPVADFYREATEKYASEVSLDRKGNLKDYTAGTPFPQEAIDSESKEAALKWAWNFQYRYRGAGPIGSFRILDLPSRLGRPETYTGDFYYLRTAHRADLAASGFRINESKGSLFVAGGRFDEPFNARHIAWRQIRPVKADRRWGEPDDTFVYVPSLRKPRRAATAWTDGLYMPRYTVAGEFGGGGLPIVTGTMNDMPQLDAISPTAGLNLMVTENLRKGFTGLATRPNAYEWKLLGMREVLAPLNGIRTGYPEDRDRNFGPSGLSVAADRWDLRYAVVIRGVQRRRIDEQAVVDLWIDYQTLQPLYYISRRENGLLLDIGVLVHRFSSDTPGYPTWPGGEMAHVFDPVAASFYYVPGGGAGWRRESYDVRSLPLEPGKIRKLTAVDELSKGH